MSPDDVAIVLPSHDRPNHLRDCLRAVGALDGGPYATIVVDDGSLRSLAPVCAAAGPWVRHLRQANAGPAAARNAGVRAAEGARLVCFVDDDCRPRRDWLRRLVARHGRDATLLVGGRVVNGLPENLYSAASQAILTYSYGAFGGFDGRLSFFTTNNVCVDREAFLALGGFDEGYRFASEDRDLSYRWRKAGGRLAYAADAVVEHLHHLSWRGFVAQHFGYGRGARRFHARLAERPGQAVRLGSPLFYAGLLLHPLRRPSPRAAATTVLIGAAHVALAAGYVREAAAARRAAARRPP